MSKLARLWNVGQDARCIWDRSYDGKYYETQCGNAFVVLEDNTPEQSGMRFCPYCGLRLQTLKAKREKHK